jgi:hypothetical protein
MPTPPACRSFDLVELSSDPATISILPLASHKHHIHLSSSTGFVPLLGVTVLLAGVLFPDVPCTCVHRGGLNPSAYSTPALPSPTTQQLYDPRHTAAAFALSFFLHTAPRASALRTAAFRVSYRRQLGCTCRRCFPKTPLPDASLSLQATRDAYLQHLKITELRGT